MVYTKASGEKADVSEYIHKDFAAKLNQAEFDRPPDAGGKAANRSQLLAANRQPNSK